MRRNDDLRADALTRHAAAVLREAGVDSPEFDARELMLYAAELPDRAALLAAPVLSPRKAARFERLVSLRARRCPLQYLLGFWEFYGRRFFVEEGVLIPRPDTEILVETAAELLAKSARPLILDLCSGSGAIGVTLALELPAAHVDALEISPRALAVLRKNSKALGACVRVLAEDVLTYSPDRAYDLIVSNPPYIRETDYANLQPEVLREPKMALTAGSDGLFFYREIIRRYARALKPDGALLLEAGAGQSDDIAGLMKNAGYRDIFTRRDYGGIERAVGAYAPVH